MKDIFVMRHGDTHATENGYFAGWSDIPLSEKGKRRIQTAKQTLNGIEFGKVYVSPLSRTLETARMVIGEDHHLYLHEAIKERFFGNWEGKSWDGLEKEFPDEMREWKRDPLAFVPPQGESFSDVLRRVQIFWDHLTALDDEAYLVVTHAGIIRCLLVALTGMKFENGFHFLLEPGVIMHVKQDPAFTQIVSIVNHEDL
ncbi:MAG: histidine phosphatase family protein [Candidatus Atribacteria bacterium]|nr:histidine phosphatase family protein [Candidatus Atribacteria bacterium]